MDKIYFVCFLLKTVFCDFKATLTPKRLFCSHVTLNQIVAANVWAPFYLTKTAFLVLELLVEKFNLHSGLLSFCFVN